MTPLLVPLLVALAVLGPLSSGAARAQELRPTDERVSTAPGYFTYFLPGERTTQASVLGTVRAPGFYLVSAGTDLAELLALAGGPVLGATSPEFERTVTIRLYRASGGGVRELIYEETAEDFTRDAEGYPVVIDGDMLEVATFERRRWSWRDSLTVAGGTATVIIAVIQIVNALR